MEYVLELLKVTIPAIVVFLTAYFILKSFLDNQEKRKWMNLKINLKHTTLPIRLQAYERVILLLERLSPNNLIHRVKKSGMTAADMQAALLAEIRQEYNHNLSQQLYISEDGWALVQNAKEEMIKTVNLCYAQVNPDDQALELSRAIFNAVMKNETMPTDRAIKYLKQEARQLF